MTSLIFGSSFAFLLIYKQMGFSAAVALLWVVDTTAALGLELCLESGVLGNPIDIMYLTDWKVVLEHGENI